MTTCLRPGCLALGVKWGYCLIHAPADRPDRAPAPVLTRQPTRRFDRRGLGKVRAEVDKQALPLFLLALAFLVKDETGADVAIGVLR